MRRNYADLHLCPDLKNLKQTADMIKKAAKLGYRLTGILFPINCTQLEIQQVQNICSEAKTDLVTRVDLKPRTPNELTRILRKFRRKFEIISVVCESKNVSRQAAKDRRVDLLNFPSLDFRKRFFDMAEAELASGSRSSLEIDVKPLLTLEGPVRARLLSNLRREAAIAKGFHVPIVISSGASDGMLLRKPLEQANLSSLFDLDRDSALNAVSSNPSVTIKRNREKLSSRFVAPGIRVIRKGNDC
jgi:RNase P/RNase MRP subunit p30